MTEEVEASGVQIHKKSQVARVDKAGDNNLTVTLGQLTRARQALGQVKGTRLEATTSPSHYIGQVTRTRQALCQVTGNRLETTTSPLH